MRTISIIALIAATATPALATQQTSVALTPAPYSASATLAELSTEERKPNTFAELSVQERNEKFAELSVQERNELNRPLFAGDPEVRILGYGKEQMWQQIFT